MISGQWFYKGDFLRIGPKMHKITHNSMKNRGSTLIFTNLVEVYPNNFPTKFEANLSCGLREEAEKVIHSHVAMTKTTTTDTG